jgi:hypothetical protein
VEHFFGAFGWLGGCGCWGGFWLGEVKLRKKVVRKYLNLKGWGEGHLSKYLILKVVRYQILDSKGLAGGHVIVVVNIILKKMFHVEQFSGNYFLENYFFSALRPNCSPAKNPTSANSSRCGAP